MKNLGARLIQNVDWAETRFRQVSEIASAEPALPGGWSRKQVLGHLIDSASNNHQRFVRAALDGTLKFPGYDQDACVRVEAFQRVPWRTLVTLWASYNRYLAHLIAVIPDDKLNAQCRIGENAPVTLRFLAEDYVKHLVHHLSQIGAAAPRT